MINFEPDRARTIELVNRLPIWHLGHVKLHRPRVEDGGDRRVAHGRPGGDFIGRTRGLVRGLEARHLLGGYAVGDEAVVLPVVGAADVLPVAGAIDGGENV